MRRLSLFIILAMSVLAMSAQVSVEAEIDSIQIFVGQQAHVTISATAKENAKVEFPQFKPTQYVTPGVEVLDCKELEKKEQDNGFVTRRVYDDLVRRYPLLSASDGGEDRR